MVSMLMKLLLVWVYSVYTNASQIALLCPFLFFSFPKAEEARAGAHGEGQHV